MLQFTEYGIEGVVPMELLPSDVRSKYQAKPSDRSKRAKKEETKGAAQQAEENQVFLAVLSFPMYFNHSWKVDCEANMILQYCFLMGIWKKLITSAFVVPLNNKPGALHWSFTGAEDPLGQIESLHSEYIEFLILSQPANIM